jgi:hypothetical protein
MQFRYSMCFAVLPWADGFNEPLTLEQYQDLFAELRDRVNDAMNADRAVHPVGGVSLSVAGGAIVATQAMERRV